MPETQVREHPLLLNGEMVRAVLEGRKTQTRRPVKLPKGCVLTNNDNPYGKPIIQRQVGPPSGWRRNGDWLSEVFDGPCPWNVGEVLWVRETFTVESFGAGVAQIRYAADNSRGKNQGISDAKLPDRIGTVPSIHMPRHASRINLEVTRVRVQRVQDISGADAIAEGCMPSYDQCWNRNDGWTGTHPAAVSNFRRLWDSIYGKSYPWSENPLVWAIDFRRVT